MIIYSFFVWAVPLAFVAISSFLWILYMIRLVKNEEDLAERLLNERRRREEARRREEDSHKKAKEEALDVSKQAKDTLDGMEGAPEGETE